MQVFSLTEKKKTHLNQMKKNNFKSIDLVIVNFYPFKETLKKTSQPQKIIENIDIGGPSLVRAAAKNFNEVTVITDKFDYKEFIYEMNKYKGKTSAKFRKKDWQVKLSVLQRIMTL